jgi:ADP-ribose pyrophosphatase YjhB (NUDIX family)
MKKTWSKIMPLYQVDFSRTILVLADDEQTAIRIAESHEGDEFYNSSPECEFAQEIKSTKDIPAEWENSIPYGKGNLDYLTCSQLVSIYAQQKKEKWNEKVLNSEVVPLFDEPFSTPIPASVVIIRNSRGELLLINRNSKPFGWCLPGGKINSEESATDAAIREVKEETGLDIGDSIRKLGMSEAQDGRVIHVFAAAVSFLATVLLTSQEHSGYMWIKGTPRHIELAGKTRHFLKLESQEGEL